MLRTQLATDTGMIVRIGCIAIINDSGITVQIAKTASITTLKLLNMVKQATAPKQAVRINAADMKP